MANLGRPEGSRGSFNQKLIEGTYDSLIYELNKYVKQLETLRNKCLKDYNEVKQLSRDQADMIQLEHIRANSIKGFENFFKLKMEALKLLALVADKLAKTSAGSKIEKSFDKNDDKLKEYLAELRANMNKGRRI